MAFTYYIGSDTFVQLSDLAETISPGLINDATVTYELYNDKSGVLVDSGVMSYTGTPGEYRGNLVDTLAIALGTRLRLEITAVSPGGYTLLKIIKGVADNRT